ncbi:hydrogenase maturation protease [Pseudonocardia sp. H11422]|uniref:hydrogenase maturation protease n=1 Tax=Pseudonocardia sp. H11422 TaxID=2835866 RepID=UPI001BDC3916|nr:hydrogenase maturation protease [Pseudonocardia sp. H11422]
MTPRVLVAGVGNVFLSDDGFGVEVVRRLLARGGLPDGVEVADFGIRGMHLAYQLLDGYDGLLLVDTHQRGGAPGTVYRLEHDLDAPRDDTEPGAALDGHGMDPATVLALLAELAVANGVARPVHRVLVVGCEPAVLDEGMGLSEPVAAAVEPALHAVDELVGLLLDSAAPEAVPNASEGVRP